MSQYPDPNSYVKLPIIHNQYSMQVCYMTPHKKCPFVHRGDAWYCHARHSNGHNRVHVEIKNVDADYHPIADEECPLKHYPQT